MSTKLKVLYTQHTEGPSYFEDSEEYREDYTTFYVDGLKIDNKYLDVETSLDIKEGEKVYLLYVVYTTGDSFSTSHGGSIEFINVYRDIEVAKENERRINKKEETNDYHIILKTSNGESEYRIYTPWIGYFESIDYVEIKELTVE